MVGTHPELYGFPELSLFRAASVGDLISPASQGRVAHSRTAGLERAIAELHQASQEEASVARARRWLADRVSWPVESVFDHLQSKILPRIAVEKSPENANREDYLERLARSYPRARFLHVTRHPVPTVRSMHEAWNAARLWEVPDQLFHLHLLGTWLFNHARIKQFTEALPPDRWMRVRSEDVLNAPRETLREICRWLGVDDGPSAIDSMLHPERSPYARIGPTSALGGNDPKFLRDPVPRETELPVSMDVPEDWTVDPWLHVAVVEFAASIGYRHEPADPG